MAVTKTYNYEYGGTPGSVDVTVEVGACNVLSGDPELGTLDITITLSEALPFGLLVYVEIDNEISTIYGTTNSIYAVPLTVPAGGATFHASSVSKGPSNPSRMRSNSMPIW